MANKTACSISTLATTPSDDYGKSTTQLRASAEHVVTGTPRKFTVKSPSSQKRCEAVSCPREATTRPHSSGASGAIGVNRAEYATKHPKRGTLCNTDALTVGSHHCAVSESFTPWNCTYAMLRLRPDVFTNVNEFAS